MQNKSPQKIFSLSAIAVATFFGGPLTAGFMLSQNFRNFGNEPAARRSLYFGIIATLAIYAFKVFIPWDYLAYIPRFFIPTLYTVIIISMADVLQGKSIKAFYALHGRKASIWLAAGYGAAGFLINISVMLMFVYTIPNVTSGGVINVEPGIDLFYEGDIKRAEANKLAECIYDNNLLESADEAQIYLSNKGKTYLLEFFVIDPSLLKDTLGIISFTELEKRINRLVSMEKNIRLGLIDPTNGKHYDLVRLDNINIPGYASYVKLKRYQISRNHTILHSRNMPVKDLQNLKEAMKNLPYYFPPNRSIEVLFINNGSDYTIKYIVSSEYWQDNNLLNELKIVTRNLYYYGIKKSIKLVLMDGYTWEELMVPTSYP